MTYLDKAGIKEAFAMHLMKNRGYSKGEAAVAVSDFPDPYRLPYQLEEYIGNVEIDGIEYEQYASYTAFWRCGMDDIPMFRFYTYYAAEDVVDKKVQQYMDSRKLYQIEGLNENDFPDGVM